MKEVIHPKRVLDPQKHRKLDSTGMPWSQAVKAKGTLLFVSGQTSVDSEGSVIGHDDIVKQTEQALENLKSILEEVGASLDDVVSTNWYTTSIDDFYKKGASQVRRRYFKRDFPTSTLVEVKRLADPEYIVEVEAIAVLES